MGSFDLREVSISVQAKLDSPAEYAPTVNRTSVVPPTQHPMTIPSYTARAWFSMCISTNSAFVSCTSLGVKSETIEC